MSAIEPPATMLMRARAERARMRRLRRAPEAPEHSLGLLEDRAPEEDEPDTSEHRTRFEGPGESMRLAEGGAGVKIPPPEE